MFPLGSEATTSSMINKRPLEGSDNPSPGVKRQKSQREVIEDKARAAALQAIESFFKDIKSEEERTVLIGRVKTVSPVLANFIDENNHFNAEGFLQYFGASPHQLSGIEIEAADEQSAEAKFTTSSLNLETLTTYFPLVLKSINFPDFINEYYSLRHYEVNIVNDNTCFPLYLLADFIGCKQLKRCTLYHMENGINPLPNIKKNELTSAQYTEVCKDLITGCLDNLIYSNIPENQYLDHYKFLSLHGSVCKELTLLEGAYGDAGDIIDPYKPAAAFLPMLYNLETMTFDISEDYGSGFTADALKYFTKGFAQHVFNNLRHLKFSGQRETVEGISWGMVNVHFAEGILNSLKKRERKLDSLMIFFKKHFQEDEHRYGKMMIIDELAETTEHFSVGITWPTKRQEITEERVKRHKDSLLALINKSKIKSLYVLNEYWHLNEDEIFDTAIYELTPQRVQFTLGEYVDICNDLAHTPLKELQFQLDFFDPQWAEHLEVGEKPKGLKYWNAEEHFGDKDVQGDCFEIAFAALAKLNVEKLTLLYPLCRVNGFIRDCLENGWKNLKELHIKGCIDAKNNVEELEEILKETRIGLKYTIKHVKYRSALSPDEARTNF